MIGVIEYEIEILTSGFFKTCPKCENEEFKLVYRPKWKSSVSGITTPEYMEKTCLRCSFSFKERPKDWKC